MIYDIVIIDSIANISREQLARYLYFISIEGFCVLYAFYCIIYRWIFFIPFKYATDVSHEIFIRH